MGSLAGDSRCDTSPSWCPDHGNGWIRGERVALERLTSRSRSRVCPFLQHLIFPSEVGGKVSESTAGHSHVESPVRNAPSSASSCRKAWVEIQVDPEQAAMAIDGLPESGLLAKQSDRDDVLAMTLVSSNYREHGVLYSLFHDFHDSRLISTSMF
jgi:hypothetical protein